jgi:hypothetical protein
MLVKRRLQGMQRFSLRCHTLDRRDFGPGCLNREHRAALYRPAIYVDNASTALTGVATDMGACLSELITNQVDQ